MKLGILTSIFGNYNFEQVLDMTSEFGLECMEVACWPQGEGERRYAGVCHIDCENFTDEEAQPYINYLVVKEGNENTAKAKALKKALQSKKVKNYIKKYKGSVQAVFTDPTK